MNMGTITGYVLLSALALWIGYSFVSGDLSRPQLPILGVGAGFDGDLALPKAEIEATLRNARDQVMVIADQGYVFRIAGRLTTWLAFFCTSAITLVAGWYGQAPSPTQPGAAGTPTGLPTKATRIVTLLAALAAVLTAGSGLATQNAEALKTWSQERHKDVVAARTAVLDARDANAARTILDDLQLKLKQ